MHFAGIQSRELKSTSKLLRLASKAIISLLKYFYNMVRHTVHTSSSTVLSSLQGSVLVYVFENTYFKVIM